MPFPFLARTVPFHFLARQSVHDRERAWARKYNTAERIKNVEVA